MVLQALARAAIRSGAKIRRTGRFLRYGRDGGANGSGLGSVLLHEGRDDGVAFGKVHLSQPVKQPERAGGAELGQHSSHLVSQWAAP